MTRTELADRIDYCQKELTHLQSVNANCQSCIFRVTETRDCSKYGPIPADFMLKGCDDWQYDDVPF